MADYNGRRPIEGFPNYEVDRYGNVYSKDHFTAVPQQKGRLMPFKGKKLKLYKNPDGYWYAGMMDSEHKMRSKSVHRLVAVAFVPNPDGLPCVNHIDENVDNNRADNLEWCTWQYNATYATANKRRRQAQLGKPKANGKGVMGKRIEETEWKFYPSLRNASRALGIADCNIGHVCRGREKQAKGYVFRYATPSEVKKFGEYEKE